MITPDGANFKGSMAEKNVDAGASGWPAELAKKHRISPTSPNSGPLADNELP